MSAREGVTGKVGQTSHRETDPGRLASCVPMGCLATPMRILRPTTINQAAKYHQPVLTVSPENYRGTDFAPHKPVAQFRALAGAQGAGSRAVSLYIYAIP